MDQLVDKSSSVGLPDQFAELWGVLSKESNDIDRHNQNFSPNRNTDTRAVEQSVPISWYSSGTYELFALGLSNDLLRNASKLSQRGHRSPPNTEQIRQCHYCMTGLTSFFRPFYTYQGRPAWHRPPSLEADFEHRSQDPGNLNHQVYQRMPIEPTSQRIAVQRPYRQSKQILMSRETLPVGFSHKRLTFQLQ